MPDWLLSTLTALPLFIGVVVLVGVPWTLLALPRRDWPDRPLVACLALLFGPAWLSVWMFVLGTLGQNDDPNAGDSINPMQTVLPDHIGGEALMRPGFIIAGLTVISFIGIILAWRKDRITTPPSRNERHPLIWDEKLLIVLIMIATVARWLIQSWLEFGAWDALWVYGYQGRIYTLVGYIPADIGYYPQFLPMQYAFAQIMTGGSLNDHAARAIMPLLQIGSILAVYVLGQRLFNRRTGIIAAALWALYPHFGYWTRVGDLEIPQTFAFTASAAFFLMAWMQAEQGLRRRYALIAGLCFGVAMWMKPTAGAFVLGVVLLVMVEMLRVRLDWRAWWPRFEVALITGIACLPLGAVWYVRNILIGHDAIVFPPSFWPTQAMRSGAEFGWPLLALLVLLAYLLFGPYHPRPRWLPLVIGVILITLGVGPGILSPHRMDLLEWLAFAGGLCVIAYVLVPFAQRHITPPAKRALVVTGWAWLLGLPYFVTWFYSYSYHYRLSFAIVPLMLLPTAVILAAWFTPQRLSVWRPGLRAAYAVMVIALAVPGIAIAIYDQGLGWDWLWTRPAEDDYSQAGILGVVATLEEYEAAHDEPIVVIAPGLQPLPFFFPEREIRVAVTPRETSQLTGATHFVNSSIGLQWYEWDGEVAPFQNQWLASLPRTNVTTQTGRFQDPSFVFEVYELHLEARFTMPDVDHQLEDEVIFGNFSRLVGYSISSDVFNGDVQLELVWQALQPAAEDLSLYVHLIREGETNTPWAGADGPVRYWGLNYYSTWFWEPGEYIIDQRTLSLQNPDTPSGDDYRVRLGFYVPSSGQRMPVTVNGEAAGDGYMLDTVFTVPEPPG